MNGIMGFAQLLQQQQQPWDQQKNYLDIIYTQTKHLLRLINDIVDISKIEADQLKLNLHEFNFNHVMDELYAIHIRQLKEKKGKDIELVIEKGLEDRQSYLYTDENRFRQVLENLLGNAIKFTTQGKITMGYTLENTNIKFYVKDTGIGIDPEHQHTIFERFRQIDNSTSREYEGTGLGLTISQSLVEKMGGTMGVDSKKGEGSVFYFTLPLNSIKEPAAEIKPKEKTEKSINGKTILLVEDDPASLKYMEEILKPTGVNLLLTETGEGAYQTYKNNPGIDLILMDIRLPDINGMEITKRIRKADKNILIIAQTAHAMGDDKRKCMDAGANDYIAKPIDQDELLTKIRQHLT
jgi:CheY-like chemotaxis protein